MNEQLSLRRYRRDCLLGMLDGMLMLANAIWAGRQILGPGAARSAI